MDCAQDTNAKETGKTLGVGSASAAESHKNEPRNLFETKQLQVVTRMAGLLLTESTMSALQHAREIEQNRPESLSDSAEKRKVPMKHSGINANELSCDFGEMKLQTRVLSVSHLEE